MSGLKTHRWNNIFGKDGKTVIFAMDHAASFGLMEGLEKPGEVIRKVRDGGADAILTTYGIAAKFGDEIGGMGLVLRVDGGSTMLAKERGVTQLMFTIQDAVRIGADAVGAMGMPGSVSETETLPYLASLVSEGAEWGMPVMAEMLPAGFENPKEWWTPQNIGSACRIGAEMGVDFIKTTFSGDLESFKNIVSQLYVPVVVLGGGKIGEPKDLLNNIYASMQAGANGVAVGRNIYQYKDPEKITAAIAAIVHDGATVDDAMKCMK
jgi:DhnA family fructose-bisphosphate aldolase class Ia